MFLNLTALRKAKISYNSGLSECKRVKASVSLTLSWFSSLKNIIPKFMYIYIIYFLFSLKADSLIITCTGLLSAYITF